MSVFERRTVGVSLADASARYEFLESIERSDVRRYSFGPPNALHPGCLGAMDLSVTRRARLPTLARRRGQR
jgi:hypothetical protein